MKRRTFLSGLAAATSGPAVPVGVLANAARPTVDPELLKSAAEWVGLWDRNSVWMLKYRFGLQEDAAEGLFDALVQDGVIAPPAPDGLGRVLASTYPNPFKAAKLKTVLARSEASAASRSFDEANRKSLRDNDKGHAHDYRIRAAEMADVAGIAGIWLTGRTGANDPAFHSAIRDALTEILVAGTLGRPVGFVMLQSGGVYHLAVVQEERGRGIGRRLLTAGEKRLSATGCEVSRLYCEAGNEAAQALLRRAGYVEVAGPEERKIVHFLKLLPVGSGSSLT